MKFICRMCKAEFSNPKGMADHAYNEHVKPKQTVNQMYEKSLENGGFLNEKTETKEWQHFQAMTDKERADFCPYLWGWAGMEKSSKAFAD